VGVELNTTEQKYEFKFSEDKVIKTTQQHWYKLQSDRIEYLKLRYFKSQQEWHKVKWLKAANDRKKFLSSCKTEHAKILLDSLKDKRFICFTGSIAQSEELSNGFSVHSGVSKNLRQEMITDFNTGKVDKLFVTGMLREGQNLNNIEAGVVIQLDNNEKYYYQTQGRVLRSLAPEFYILYVKNTQDEKYTQTVLENFNMEYVTYKDLKGF
ncbi:MAG TPA: helicase-related protein, partial [Candidatus Dojkabacteria bacterium]|nr:helicase-related protein [Candidatus Dojkabacteria bacterium]